MYKVVTDDHQNLSEAQRNCKAQLDGMGRVLVIERAAQLRGLMMELRARHSGVHNSYIITVNITANTSFSEVISRRDTSKILSYLSLLVNIVL